MSDLRAVAAQIGLRDPRSLLQSGNLVFEADAVAPAEVAARLSGALAASLALETAVLVRSAVQWAEIVHALPFADMAREDPSRLVVMALASTPDPQRRAALEGAIVGRERVAVMGTTAYIAYLDGIGRSKLSASVVERHLGTTGTGRNWRTVLKIAAALEG